MAFNLVPTGATLGAVVTDVDLAGLDEVTWRGLEEAFHDYAVLVFPGQNLEPQSQVAFAERFGRIEPLTPDPEAKAVPLTNMRAGGTLADPQEHHSLVLKGNEGWHTDSSYMPLAARASMLSARVVPSHGGQTEWADMRAAYDALDDFDPGMRERIAGLAAYHSLYHSQATIGHDAQAGASYGFHGEGAPLRPLVKQHPVTGRRALCIGRHAYGIPGLDAAESERLLRDLLDFACRPPRTHRHAWAPGDLAVWDNRAVLHRARPFDPGEARLMLHTRIAGDPESEWAPPDPRRR